VWLGQLVVVEPDWNVRAQIFFGVCANSRTKDMASTLRVMVMRFPISWLKITLVLPTTALAGQTFQTGKTGA
jgi:homoaconitase/3-isopropylmalate dehydratase large subunit